MLHSVRISGGKAKLCSRYVKTYKYKQEGSRGYPFFVSPFSSFNGHLATVVRCAIVVARVITGYYNPILEGFGTANTNLAFFCGSIFALCESDLPYEIRVTPDGEVTTLRRRDFCTAAPFPRMTAHPKTDPATGEVFAFRCDIFPPFLTFFKIDSKGIKGRDLPIFSIKRTPCIHDFAITKRFIVFQDIQIDVRPIEMIMKGITPVVYDRRKTPRIGILRRDAEDETRLCWIDAPGLNMLHVINAWEEDCGDKLVIVAPNLVSIECGLSSLNLVYSIIEKIILDVKEKKVVSRQQLCNMNVEFGVINQTYIGKTNKYVYAAVIDEIPKATGVVKLDLSAGCEVGRRMYGEGCYGGEPYFVAREPHNPAAAEDDGYVIVYVQDENKEESWFLVMNAKSTTLDIVAKVRLPGRVPYGFHGLFVAQNDLN
ncbi:hypothetical protein ACS0TY_011826 [Phlomoides rotata]